MPWHKGILKSVHTRIFFVLCITVLPSFAGLGFYVYQQRDYLTHYSIENGQRFAELAARDENWLFTSTRDIFQAISHMSFVREKKWDACHEYMGRLLQSQNTYYDMGLVSVSGASLCSGRYPQTNLAGINFSDREYFQRALNENGPVVSTAHSERITDKPVIFIATALRKPDNTPWAIMYSSIDVAATAREQKAGNLPGASSILILDRNGVVLNSQPPQTDITIGEPLKDPLVLRLIKRNVSGSTLAQRRDNSQWLISHTHTGTAYDPNALTVVYQYPTAAAVAEMDHSLLISTGLALLLALLTLTLGWVGIQTFIGSNIQHLVTAAKRLSQGKFDTRVTKKISGQEFVDIAAQLDTMAEALGKQELQWEQSMQRQLGRNIILKMTAENRPLTETLTALVHNTEEDIKDSSAAILLLSSDGEHIDTCIAPSLPESHIKSLLNSKILPNIGTIGSAMAMKQFVVTPDVSTDPTWESLRDVATAHRLKACWAHPILTADGKVTGALAVYYPKAGMPSAEALQYSQMASEVANVAIEHSRHYQALRFRSQHDELTGLLKREALVALIDEEISQAGQEVVQLYVVSLNLEGFKEINSTFGHQLGDELLRATAARMRDLIGSSGQIARSGGNEFTLFFTEKNLRRPIRDMAQEILDEIRRPVVLEGTEMQISTNIGIAPYPIAGNEAHMLLRHAGSAMNQAQREGSGFTFYNTRLQDQTPNRLMMLSDLRRALNADELVVYYQPQISLRRHRPIGFEALVRWQHPEKGLIPPGHFMPIAEFSDLIHPLTLWVLDKAIAQCRYWHRHGHNITVSVNISARDLLIQEFPSQIQQLLLRHKLPTHYLELEITESAIMIDATRSLGVLHRIRALGVRIAIDDFGTGHSSLSYLHKLPADNLKIDQSFIREMENDKESQAIVDSIIALTHNLKISVTAEGVEDQASLVRLMKLGCDYAQGYLISPPIPSNEANNWLKKHMNPKDT